MVALFSYGTLRQANVQMATFGRLLEGTADALVGYRLAPMPILDPYVVETSGLATHTIAIPSGDSGDRIEGIRFEISDAELEAADGYEVAGIDRIETVLASGARAFVYVRGEE
jgi:hypothetical protein